MHCLPEKCKNAEDLRDWILKNARGPDAEKTKIEASREFEDLTTIERIKNVVDADDEFIRVLPEAQKIAREAAIFTYRVLTPAVRSKLQVLSEIFGKAIDSMEDKELQRRHLFKKEEASEYAYFLDSRNAERGLRIQEQKIQAHEKQQRILKRRKFLKSRKQEAHVARQTEWALLVQTRKMRRQNDNENDGTPEGRNINHDRSQTKLTKEEKKKQKKARKTHKAQKAKGKGKGKQGKKPKIKQKEQLEAEQARAEIDEEDDEHFDTHAGTSEKVQSHEEDVRNREEDMKNHEDTSKIDGDLIEKHNEHIENCEEENKVETGQVENEEEDRKDDETEVEMIGMDQVDARKGTGDEVQDRGEDAKIDKDKDDKREDTHKENKEQGDTDILLEIFKESAMEHSTKGEGFDSEGSWAKIDNGNGTEWVDEDSAEKEFEIKSDPDKHAKKTKTDKNKKRTFSEMDADKVGDSKSKDPKAPADTANKDQDAKGHLGPKSKKIKLDGTTRRPNRKQQLDAMTKTRRADLGGAIKTQHLLMGHCGFANLWANIRRQLLRNPRLKCMLREARELCIEACVHSLERMRSSQHPHGKFGGVSAKSPDEWFTMDVFEAVNKKTYALHAMNLFSRYSVITILTRKPTKEDAVQFLGECRRTGVLAKRLLVDNGGEFKNATFIESCDLLGCQVLFSAPGAHWTVGSVERRHRVFRSVMDKVSVLAGGDNAKRVLQAACDSVNTMPSRSLNWLSPFQVQFARSSPAECVVNFQHGEEKTNTVAKTTAEEIELRMKCRRALEELAVDKQFNAEILKLKDEQRRRLGEMTISVGDMCDFWIEKGKSGYWGGPGRCIYVHATDGTTPTYVIDKNSSYYRRHASHVRRHITADAAMFPRVATKFSKKDSDRWEEELVRIREEDFDGCTEDDLLIQADKLLEKRLQADKEQEAREGRDKLNAEKEKRDGGDAKSSKDIEREIKLNREAIREMQDELLQRQRDARGAPRSRPHWKDSKDARQEDADANTTGEQENANLQENENDNGDGDEIAVMSTQLAHETAAMSEEEKNMWIEDAKKKVDDKTVSEEELLRNPLIQAAITKEVLAHSDVFEAASEEDLKGTIPIPCRLLLMVKRNGRVKARTVCAGFLEGQPFYSGFASTLDNLTLRFLFHLVANAPPGAGWIISDATSAFIQADYLSDAPVVASLDSRLEKQFGFKYARIKKCLNGLKNSASGWSIHRNRQILSEGWKPCKNDSCLFYKNNCLLGCFVDNFIFVGDLSQITAYHEQLGVKLKLVEEPNTPTKTGVIYDILGAAVHVEPQESGGNKVTVSQNAHVEKIVKTFGDDSSSRKRHPTPFIDFNDSDFEPEGEETDKTLVKTKKGRNKIPKVEQDILSLRGTLNYLQLTRFDLEFALRRLTNLKPEATLRGLRKIVRYLRDNPKMDVVFQKNDNIFEHSIWGESDASWGNMQEKSAQNRGVSGMMVGIGKNVLLAQSKVQSLTTLSTTESETVAASDTARDYLTLHNLASEVFEKCKGVFGKLEKQIEHHLDNRSTVLHVSQPQILKKLRHLQVRKNFCRELCQLNITRPFWRAGKDMRSDGLTKVVPACRWEDCLKKLGLTRGK
jgi:transposase InsO family protein